MSGDIVVYTAVFNDYDVLLQPEVTPSNVDFICFTDEKDIAKGVWEPHLINEYEISPKLMSGKVKTLPHQFFSEYDYSVWVDGNIHIIGDIRKVLKECLQDQESNMAVPSHPRRSCIYDEAEACIRLDKADPERIRAQMKRYRNLGFPEEYGLSETRILLRKHNEEEVVEAMGTWWKEYKKGAERDQLSFEFAAWKCDFEYKNWVVDYENSEYFRLYPHKISNERFGDVWELLLRTQAKRSGTSARLLELSRGALGIYADEGLIPLLRKASDFLWKNKR
ncbi:hypothetical protein CP556_21695 [Natrinema sp. CBA1119]|uniref:glycosyltransferase domain-containing protein n=1 Tax=Natrinema sp. CBA1119 TaxID=1608465 RepID=UPI000BF833FF|nr:glycosyltransferase domain-containing protein [Natrinema sp. CBA1119]PGF14326.1 hypothetical protein CP556_22135 [Natrinema sp. CBA1119]PGF14392.1 hypothetical protein CP556_21695 [Natrinema sp. CBA1119]